MVTFAKVKLHPTTSKMRTAYQRDTTRLFFVWKEATTWANWEAPCGCEVPTNLYCGIFIFFSFIFLKEGILHVTTLETWQNQYWRWTWCHWQMTHVEFANDVVHLHNMNNNRIPPNNTRLGSIYSLIMEPRSTPSSTLFLTIIYYFIMIRNC